MRYVGMPWGMWLLFAGSFRRQLSAVYGYDPDTAKAVTDKAKPKYREIIGRLPEFEKADRFKMNIVNCALLSAFLLNLPKRTTVEKATEYYRASMMTAPMKWFCRMSGKKKFSERDIQGMKATAALRAADRNPYSWNMEYRPYPDGSGYEARFRRRWSSRSSEGLCAPSIFRSCFPIRSLKGSATAWTMTLPINERKWNPPQACSVLWKWRSGSMTFAVK